MNPKIHSGFSVIIAIWEIFKQKQEANGLQIVNTYISENEVSPKLCSLK